MSELDKDKTKGWSWPAYLFVGLALSFASVVAWPMLKEYASRRMAEAPTAKNAEPTKEIPPQDMSKEPQAKEAAQKEPPQKPQPKDELQPKVEMPPKVQSKDEPLTAQFREVAIEEPFDALFARRKILMDTPQVHEFALPDGKFGVVCVVQAKLHQDTAAGRVDAGKVCSNKMAAALLEWKKGLDTQRATDVVGSDERLDEAIRTAMKGHVRTLPAVGRWVSSKGDVFYMAFGELVPVVRK